MSELTKVEQLIIDEIKENRKHISKLQDQMTFIKSMTIFVSAFVGFFSSYIKKKMGM